MSVVYSLYLVILINRINEGPEKGDGKLKIIDL